MENAIISPEGNVTDSWQLDTPLFTNVSTGLAIVPIAGSTLYRVYTATDAGVISFVFNPQNITPYDMSNASGYTGYALKTHANPVSVFGISKGVPFLGKTYCIATTDLYLTGGELTTSSLAFGTIQNLTSSEISVTITNNTGGNVILTGVTFSGTNAADFGQSGSFPQTVAASGTYTFPLVFFPTTNGSKTATLNVTSDIGILQANITGTAESKLAVTDCVLNSGNGYQELFTITNSGNRTVSISSITITGPDASLFFYTVISPPLTISASGTATGYAVLGDSSQSGTYSATLNIIADVGTATGSLTGVV